MWASCHGFRDEDPMIITSTRSAIVWKTRDGDTITFYGEWTVTPKFYLSPEYRCTLLNHADGQLSSDDVDRERREMMEEAQRRGWVVVDG